MKKIGTKQIVPLVLAVFAVVFAVVGFTQLGFWEDVDGPQPVSYTHLTLPTTPYV